MPEPIIYFVRHGETDWNAVGRLQGQRDIAINATGRAQAANCGAILRLLMDRLGRSPVSFCYVSSPLRRARATMELLRPVLGLAATDYAIDDRLREIAYGDWEGLTVAETRARDPDICDMRDREKWNNVPPGGESYAQLALRVAAWRSELAADTVVSAHGGTLRALMVISGFEQPAIAADLRIEQGAVYAFAGGTLVKHGA